MRHGMANRKLGRTSSHRKAMFRNQLASLIQSERIVTTLIKAKELRPIAEKMITIGKKDSMHARRVAGQSLSDHGIVQKLFDDIAPRFAERQGGYTRIIKLGPRRGDGAEMAILEFVDYKLEGAAAPDTTKKEKKAAAPKKQKSEEGDEAAEEKPKKKPAAKKAAAKKPAAKASSKKKKS